MRDSCFRRLVLAGGLAIGALALASPAAAQPVFCGGADTICYDDVVTAAASFTGIQETVQTADDSPATALDGLYQAPVALGNGLFFDPDSFDATSMSAGGLDQTHSLLNMTITANGAGTLDSIVLTENGDFTFGGFGGTAATGISQTIGGSLTITDALDASLIGDIINIDATLQSPAISETFTVTSDDGTITEIGGGFAAGIPDGIGTFNWQIEYVLDLTGLGVTQLELQLNNIQFANSEASTSASVFKKVSLAVVPEPSTGTLLGLGLAGLALTRRRIRR